MILDFDSANRTRLQLPVISAGTHARRLTVECDFARPEQYTAISNTQSYKFALPHVLTSKKLETGGLVQVGHQLPTLHVCSIHAHIHIVTAEFSDLVTLAAFPCMASA